MTYRREAMNYVHGLIGQLSFQTTPAIQYAEDADCSRAASRSMGILGRVKLLSAASSAAVLFNGIKESWRLARKILSQFKLLWFLNVFR